MSIVSRAWQLQHYIENKTVNIPQCSLSTFLFFMSLVFFLAGFMFMVFCFLYGIHPMELQVMSSPVFYLVMGLVLFGFFIGERQK